MSVLTWWLIPLVATLAAIVVMSVANRSRGPGPSERSVEEFQRFRTALEQQTHAHHRDRHIEHPDRPAAPDSERPGSRRGPDS